MISIGWILEQRVLVQTRVGKMLAFSLMNIAQPTRTSAAFAHFMRRGVSLAANGYQISFRAVSSRIKPRQHSDLKAWVDSLEMTWVALQNRIPKVPPEFKQLLENDIGPAKRPTRAGTRFFETPFVYAELTVPQILAHIAKKGLKPCCLQEAVSVVSHNPWTAEAYRKILVVGSKYEYNGHQTYALLVSENGKWELTTLSIDEGEKIVNLHVLARQKWL
jgi:hypothetical protein